MNSEPLPAPDLLDGPSPMVCQWYDPDDGACDFTKPLGLAGTVVFLRELYTHRPRAKWWSLAPDSPNLLRRKAARNLSEMSPSNDQMRDRHLEQTQPEKMISK
jgi:hypothetical protein